MHEGSDLSVVSNEASDRIVELSRFCDIKIVEVVVVVQVYIDESSGVRLTIPTE